MDSPHVDRSKMVDEKKKSFYISSRHTLCFNPRSDRQPRKPKQILNGYLSHRRFTHCVQQLHSRLDWLAGGKIKLVDGLIE